MCNLHDIVSQTREDWGTYPVFVFGSAMHGCGRSAVSRRVAQIIDRNGWPGERIGVGDVLRRVAEEKGMTIDEFSRLESEEPSKFYAMNMEIDRQVLERVEEAQNDRIVVVDSNIAAYYLGMPNVFAFLIYAPPDVVAKRVLTGRRPGDQEYQSWKEALNALVERTRNDVRTYLEIGKLARDAFWKKVYTTAAEDMERNLNKLLEGSAPESPYYHASIYNGGSLEETVKKWCGIIEKIGKHLL